MKNNVLLITFSLITVLLVSCSDEKEEQYVVPEESYQVAYLPDKDAEIQRQNLEIMKKNTKVRFPCDTISLIEFVLNNYPEGTYLLETDKTLTYDIPEHAVIYYDKNSNYIFGVIAKSKSGERFIEPKNIIGFDQSFIDLDSTELGTAFFYLVLFECSGNSFNVLWEAVIPSHGGFNRFSLKYWDYRKIPYIEVNFHYGQGIGHINYNYFLVEGITKPPHLLMTYEGINFERSIANINDDNYPDYYEHVFIDAGGKIYSPDSVAFYWSPEESVYINSRNRKQVRPY
ncbi:MAG: hypothetical protein Kow0098_10640 [Ignavibacteriaceae bacterium]